MLDPLGTLSPMWPCLWSFWAVSGFSPICWSTGGRSRRRSFTRCLSWTRASAIELGHGPLPPPGAPEEEGGPWEGGDEEEEPVGDEEEPVAWGLVGHPDFELI